MVKVGDKVGLWCKNECTCGEEYYISRTFEKIVTEKDIHCHHCNDAFELDLIKKDLKTSNDFIKSLVEVAEELNYRLRKTDEQEGFYSIIELSKKFLKENNYV